jgi:AcrR family transcriptional regulator
VHPVKGEHPLPRGVNAASREAVAASQRSRLLAAMKTLVAREGYPAVTIAAIVREAGVAKPTFYERFADKEDCFLQLLDLLIGDLIGLVAARLPGGSTPFERIDLAIGGLLEHFAGDEAAARIVLLESSRAGEAAVQRLTDAQGALATLYRESREQLRLSDPELPPISETRALAIVGAINQPILMAVRAGETEQLGELHDELCIVAHALAFATP